MFGQHLDLLEREAVALVASQPGGALPADCEAANVYSDDREIGPDTWNGLFVKGVLIQVQTGDDDFEIRFRGTTQQEHE